VQILDFEHSLKLFPISGVMAGLEPAIHVLVFRKLSSSVALRLAWMAGTSPAMTR
jgi:hypothetical protein